MPAVRTSGRGPEECIRASSPHPTDFTEDSAPTRPAGEAEVLRWQGLSRRRSVRHPGLWSRLDENGGASWTRGHQGGQPGTRRRPDSTLHAGHVADVNGRGRAGSGVSYYRHRPRVPTRGKSAGPRRCFVRRAPGTASGDRPRRCRLFPEAAAATLSNTPMATRAILDDGVFPGATGRQTGRVQRRLPGGGVSGALVGTRAHPNIWSDTRKHGGRAGPGRTGHPGAERGKRLPTAAIEGCRAGFFYSSGRTAGPPRRGVGAARAAGAWWWAPDGRGKGGHPGSSLGGSSAPGPGRWAAEPRPRGEATAHYGALRGRR